MTEYICEPIRDFEWDSGYECGYIRKGELIRCKDCKFYRQEIDMCDEPYSTAHNVVHEDDYCSRAERKEE